MGTVNAFISISDRRRNAINPYRRIGTMENGKRNELEIDRTNSSRIQYLENDLWKMRIKMLSDLKNNETQLRDERLVEMVRTDCHSTF